MKDVIIKGTEETPSIEFNANEGCLLIKGRSIPEDPFTFYAPLLESLSKYHQSPSSKTKVGFQFEYFNTSSSKCILEILKQLQTLSQDGNNVEVDWYYDENDEDILEIGEDYSNMIKIPFNLKMISNN